MFNDLRESKKKLAIERLLLQAKTKENKRNLEHRSKKLFPWLTTDRTDLEKQKRLQRMWREEKWDEEILFYVRLCSEVFGFTFLCSWAKCEPRKTLLSSPINFEAFRRVSRARLVNFLLYFFIVFPLLTVRSTLIAFLEQRERITWKQRTVNWEIIIKQLQELLVSQEMFLKNDG